MKKHEKIINKYSKLLEIDGLMNNSFFSLDFKNKTVEKEYKLFSYQNSRCVRMLINLANLIELWTRFFIYIKEKPNLFFYLELSLTFLITGIFVLIEVFYKTKIKLSKFMNYFFLIWAMILHTYHMIFIHYLKGGDAFFFIKVRNLYEIIIISFLIVAFRFDLDFIFISVIYAFEIGILIFFVIENLSYDFGTFKEITTTLLLIFFSYFINKKISIILRQNFLQNYKLEQFFSYFFNLNNEINHMQVTIKNRKAIIINEKFRKFSLQMKNKDKIINYNYNNNNNSKIKERESNHFSSKIPTRSDIKIEHLEKNNLNFDPNNRNKIINKDSIRQKINIKIDKIHSNDINEDYIRNQNENKATIYNRNLYLNCASDRQIKTIKEDANDIRNKNEDKNVSNYIDCSKKECEKKVKENNERIFVNDFNAINIDKDDDKNECIQETEISINSDNYEYQNNLVNIFLKNLELKSIEENFFDLKASNLFKILDNIRLSNLTIGDDCFRNLGEFELESENKHFQVHFRKYQGYNDIIDLLIYDLSDVKEAHKKNIFLKSKFFAKIAHEFKTPINSIIGTINILNNSINVNLNLNSLKKHLNQVENLSHYMIFLINDIIEYSNLQSHENNLYNRKNVDKNDCDDRYFKNITKTINDCSVSNNANYNKNFANDYKKNKNNFDNSNISKNNDLGLHYVKIKDITCFIMDVLKTLLIFKDKHKHIKCKNYLDNEINNYLIKSDENRLKEILLIFISNSIKFTKSGLISLKSEIISDSNSQNQSQKFLKISVIDTGIGIRAESLELLKGYRGREKDIDNIINYNEEGSGLGLLICKFLADKLNHKIEFKSDYGKGSCFSIILLAYRKENHFECFEAKKKNKIISNSNKDIEDYSKQARKFDSEFIKQDRKDFNIFINNNYLQKGSFMINNSQNSNIPDNNRNCDSESKHESNRKFEYAINTNRSISKLSSSKKTSSSKFKENEDSVKTLNKSFRPFYCNEEENNLRSYFNQIRQKNQIKNFLLRKETDSDINVLDSLNKNKAESEKIDLSKFDKNSLFFKKNNISMRDSIFDLAHDSGERDHLYSFSLNRRKNIRKTINPVCTKVHIQLDCEKNNSPSIVFKKKPNYCTKENKNNIKDEDINFLIKQQHKNKINSIISINKPKNEAINCNYFSESEENPTIIKTNLDFVYSDYIENNSKENSILLNNKEKIGIDLKTKKNQIKEEEIDNNKLINDQMKNKVLEKNEKLPFNNDEKILLNFKACGCKFKNSSLLSSSLDLDKKDKILIVDDHKNVRDCLKNSVNKILKKKNLADKYEIMEGRDGCDIIYLLIHDQFKNNKIRCVITDENMEFINGSEAVKILRNLERKNKIKPITIATVSAFEDDIMKTFLEEAGVNYFMPKPCGEKQLSKFFEEFKIFSDE